jgi:hypothetical protein
VNRIRIDRPRIRRERAWLEVLPADPRDPDVAQAKAFAEPRRPTPRPAAARQAHPADGPIDQRRHQPWNDGNLGPGSEPTRPSAVPIQRSRTGTAAPAGLSLPVARHVH